MWQDMVYYISRYCEIFSNVDLQLSDGFHKRLIVHVYKMLKHFESDVTSDVFK